MAYRNYMEDAVLSELKIVLDRMADTCRCARCRDDVVAWVLNRMPPKYVVTDAGSTYTKLALSAPQVKEEISLKISEAVKIIKANPRH